VPPVRRDRKDFGNYSGTKLPFSLILCYVEG
jgi:hypothetical protein